MPQRNSREANRVFWGLMAGFMAVIVGCGTGKEPTALNLVENDNPAVNRSIGDSSHRFYVLGEETLRRAIASGRLLAPNTEAARTFLANHTPRLSTTAGASSPDAEPSEDNLIVGYPLGLLGEQQVFGGVITKVSDPKSEKLGLLKLSDITPIHVQSFLAKNSSGNYVFALAGCLRDCKEGSALTPLLTIPVVGVDAANKAVMLDIAALGKGLNLVDELDPDGEYTGLKTVSSKTTAVDYSLSTLVFDIEVRMQPKKAPETPVADTVFSGRWYLRLGSVFNPLFTPRLQVPGVGYFLTERAAEKHIQRFSRPSSVGGTPQAVKYYVKNVPAQFKPAFASAFDAWNAKFTAVTGGPLFEYEFVDAASPKAKLLVPGDIRYNILEWDLDNKATYGGFGPSIANQYTGEILSANVLIQGPTILSLYTKWFQVEGRAAALRAEGRFTEADRLQLEAVRELRAGETKAPEYRLTLNDNVPFRIGAGTAALEDPKFQRDDFDPLPVGVTFEKYMFGYFHDMVTHELGHNLGLRHNFRGNLSAKPVLEPGGVSGSIMEYLGRGFRYLDDLGPYDEMAIKYGYLGVAPNQLGLFCTDENVADDKTAANSPECSRDDATVDPFQFFEMRLSRAVGLLVARDTVEAPVWKVPDMERELKIAVQGMGLYAARVETTAAGWTNFFGVDGRPATPAEVKPFVLARLKAKLCDDGLKAIVQGKATAEAKAKTIENLTALRKRTVELLNPLTVFKEAELDCVD